MNMIRKKEAALLFLGDISVLFVSLYLTITLRYNGLPSQGLLFSHLAPFSFLFLVSILINFIAGLYEKHTLILKKKLPIILFKVQVVNTIVSIVFFYFVPYFNITPKAFLFIYLIISLIFMVAWRMSVVEPFRTGRRNKAILLAHGKEIGELHDEIKNNSRHTTTLVEWIDTKETNISGQYILDLIKSKNINLIIADFSNPQVNQIMPVLYNCIFSGVQFVDAQKMYEEIFDRVPLSLVNDSWFLENVSQPSKISFDIFKRIMDILVSGIVGIISLVIYPFVYIAIKLDDKGPIFIVQNRVGKSNNIVHIKKFRSMMTNDHGDYDSEKNKITRVGSFLRKSRIDELPQLWSVFSGKLSLIGPRPELPHLAKAYEKEIPYFNARQIIKPGLSGWAQIYGEHQHHGKGIEETNNKLSYDLYYIKNRSIALDVKIALQTLKVLMSFVGR